jgi:phosphoribosylamine---glycine ligase
MKVLIVGGGGREHALAWRFVLEDPGVELIAAPGNAGIAEHARCVPVAPTDLDGLVALAESERPTLTVVGPEGPLALGIADRFRERGMLIFGPSRAAAKIESSKVFAKRLMTDAGVPTGKAERHTDPQAARRAARRLGLPVVIKASGLAAGKGVIVAETALEADQAIDAMLTHQRFGAAGTEILVEEYLRGEEVSLHFLTNGTKWVPFVPAQDHKRLLNGDQGPNTGGMGAYAPVYPVPPSGGAHSARPARSDFAAATTNPGGSRTVAHRVGAAHASPAGPEWAALVRMAAQRIVEPTLAALRESGSPFTGVLYAGLMLTDDGPKVVEFNCRMGDPETQAILPLTRFNVLPLMRSAAAGDDVAADWLEPSPPQYAVATVVAAAGYPEHPKTGDPIQVPPAPDGIHVFHAGTARNSEGQLVTAGGRVLAVTAVAADLADAQRASADFAARVEFAGKHFRTDIAWRELARHARTS